MLRTGSASPSSSSASNGAKLASHRGVRPALFYTMFAVLFAGNVALGAALFTAPDIAKLLTGQNDQIITAYENRIDQLRLEVDRLYSRSYAQTGDINLQLQDLSQQQAVLMEQHELVKSLAGKAEELGLQPLPIAAAPTPLPLTTGAISTTATEISETARSLTAMMDETRQSLDAISRSANGKTSDIVRELRGVGIAVDMPPDGELAIGGPLLPPIEDGAEASLLTDANDVLSSLIRYKAARAAIGSAPVHIPVGGLYRQSSGFGNRNDPFSGGRAFHAGLDFAAPSGTLVLSAGDGKVTFVGTKSGYGNVVEVTHGNGLLTRYGHLSSFLSKTGQTVHTGTPIAKVGSTGRSTGPHLHFEVRRDSGPLDPAPFISAGKRLQHVLS